jgi:hypothetical protein
MESTLGSMTREPTVICQPGIPPSRDRSLRRLLADRSLRIATDAATRQSASEFDRSRGTVFVRSLHSRVRPGKRGKLTTIQLPNRNVDPSPVLRRRHDGVLLECDMVPWGRRTHQLNRTYLWCSWRSMDELGVLV